MHPKTLPATLWTLTALVLLTALNLPAQAQWLNNPVNGMAMVTNQAGNDSYPQIVPMANGRYCVMWIRFNDIKLRYQILDANGVPQLGVYGQPIIDGAWEIGYERFLISDGAGGAICVFSDNRSGVKQVYGQRIDANGNRLWGDNGLPIIISPSVGIGLKGVVKDSLGNIFIAALFEGVPVNSICVQKINTNGLRQWGDYGIVDCNGVSLCDWQKIVPDGRGGVIDVWEDNRDYGGSPNELYVQHIDDSGTPLWIPNGVMLRSPQGDQLFGSICGIVSDDRGGAIVSCLSPATNVAYVFRIGDGGVVTWIWYKTANYFGFNHALTRSPEDGMIWFSVLANAFANREETLLFKLNPNTGTQLFGFNGLPLGGQTITPVQGGMLITECQMEGMALFLKARKVTNQGSLTWETLAAVHGWWESTNSIAVTSDSADGIVFAFEDGRYQTTRPDISAQRVLSDGRLGTPNPPDPSGKLPDSLAVDLQLSVRPNPFNPTTTFRFTLPEAAQVSLEVFDVNGRVVGAHCVRPVGGGGGSQGARSAPLQAGSHEIVFDGSNLPSGVYLYRLTVSGSGVGPTTVSGKVVILK